MANTSEYQTFAIGTSPAQAPGTIRGIRSNSASISRLICFAAALIMIASVLLGPLTFVVAFIKLYLFPDSADNLKGTAPLNGWVERTFLLNIQPTYVQYPEYGRSCSYWVYTYGGTAPGPYIHVDQGKTFHVEVVNTLGPDIKNTTRRENEYRFANSTTTHFHGLHISPGGISDNIYVHVHPNNSFRHTLTLHHDHPAGTYFVHPHLHGSTTLQTGFAMASPLVIRDRDEFWRSLPEEIFMVQRGGLDSGHTADDARLAFVQNQGLAQPASSFCTMRSFVLVNGRIGPKQTPCDTNLLRRWRIINAATDGGLVLMFRGESCHARLIARDGVYLSSGTPRKVFDSSIFVVPPGGRIDFLVKLDSLGTCELVSKPHPYVQGALGPKTYLLDTSVASCVPSAETSSSAQDFPDILPALPRYMDDLRGFPMAERRVLEWTEFSKAFQSGVAKYGINGEPYRKHPRFSVRLDRIQEWVIVNALAGDQGPAVEAHPFHLHTNHFQIIGFEGTASLLNNQEDYVIGEWRDTVYVPTPGNLTIRWIPRDYVGKTLLHCEYA